MKYCTKCVQPDTRPGIYFDENGVCGACLHELDVNNNIDWNEREEQLKGIADWARQTAVDWKSNYDCVIGVSGGKDSTFQALYARDKLNLRPLLVNGEPDSITEIGRENIENLKQLGFDLISLRPNPNIMRQLIKKDFYEFLNPAKASEFALFASAYIIADKFNIPLIIQGENQGLTVGSRNTNAGTNDDCINVNKTDTLSSGWKRYIGDGVTAEDLFMFHYDEDMLRTKGVRGIWLQYYTNEWSMNRNAEFAIKHGMAIRPEYFNPYEVGTYAPFYQLDSELLYVHQFLKYIKFGFGQCTDHACYDIREGRITRWEGVELVKRYDGKIGMRYIKEFCDYIEINVEEFWRVANSFRSPMWEKDTDDNWYIKNPIWEQKSFS
jgi:N-acetyl sugar amidotransferase